MNVKRFVLAFISVFIVFEILNYLIHGGILSSVYTESQVKYLFRPEEEMNNTMWIMWLTDLIWSFFFVFFFVKGYEKKGIAEGLRYGIYMGILFALVVPYRQYAFYPFPYSMILQWFIFGFIQILIVALLTAAIYKPKKAESAEQAPAAAGI